LRLFKSAIDPFLLESLKKMQANDLFKNYYLTGGTALSLQIGHRLSEDIDLFTKNDMDKEAILYFAKKYISEDYTIKNNSENIFQLFSDKKKLKLDFVKFPYNLIEPLIAEDGIRMIDKNDLSAMKISAAGTRGNEAKDFVDLFFLLKYIPFEKMVENFKKKYKMKNVLHYLRSVMYFDEVEEENWNSIKYLKSKVSHQTIIKKLTEEVISFERNFLIGKTPAGEK